MKEFGKRTGYRREGNTVFVTFAEGELEIQAVTERIVRVFAQLSTQRPVSKAVEGDKCREVDLAAAESGESLRITLPELVVEVSDGAKVDFYDREGRLLCRDYRGEREQAKALDPQFLKFMEQEGHSPQEFLGDHPVQVLKQMDGGECFYGLGDKTGFLNKRGYAYVNWNTDNPNPQTESFASLYKSIPFFITLKEDAVFGLFFDNTFRSYFDLGKESDHYYFFGADEGNLDYYFIGGKAMKEVLQGYAYLTGTAPLPQLWTLGYHQSRWSYFTEDEVREIAENMRRQEVPCDAIHLDIDYMDQYKVFTTDGERFPDMKKLAQELEGQGIRLVTILDPGVKIEEGYDVYEEGLKEGYFARDPQGEVYQNVVWPGDTVYPDFGRKEVRAWWAKNCGRLIDQGVSGLWMDMNEPASFQGELPGDVVFYDEERKSSHAEMHNVYGHNMARAVYQGLQEKTGKRPFVITRACYGGSQKYTIGWTGDNHSIWAHLRVAIPQLCSLGLSGMALVGTDIGGFGSDTTKELLCRWIEVGSLSPFCRNHSAAGSRRQEPWAFDEETTAIYRKYLQLRYALLPYFYDLCRQQELEGLPLMRPLVLEYEKDPQTWNLNGQFLLGERLLAAPVVEQGMTQKLVYLPEGEWYDYWTGEKLPGGGWRIRSAALDECPLYVKAGTILPKYPPMVSTMEKQDETLILELYPGDAAYLHYQDNGEDFAYREGAYNLYQFRLEGERLSVELLHRGYEPVYRRLILRCLGREQQVEFREGEIDLRQILM